MPGRVKVICIYAAGFALAALLLIQQWAHVPQILPKAVLLACPLMHLSMHRGHRHEHEPADRS